jgi:hypothetical protein
VHLLTLALRRERYDPTLLGGAMKIDIFLGAGPTWHGIHGVNVVSPTLKLYLKGLIGNEL